MRGKFNISMPNIPMPRFSGGRNTYIIVTALILVISSFAAYIITGVTIRADLPIVRKFKEPEIVMPASREAYNIAVTWDSPTPYVPLPYKTIIPEGETDDQFYERMADIDRRSLHQIVQKYPALLTNGISLLSFDATKDTPSELLDAEANLELRTALRNGAVKTKNGDTIVAIDGERSIILVETPINTTSGYMAISYDKSKLQLSVTKTAFEGWWGTMTDHLEQNDGAIVAVPANNYTYNSRAGYGVVDGGFVDNEIPRYVKSSNFDLYMGFNRNGVVTVGDQSRFANTDFTEGLGVLLVDGGIPHKEIVPALEQKQILDALAAFIEASGENPESKDYNAVPVMRKFIGTFDSNYIRAKTAWVLENRAVNSVIEKKLMPKDTPDINIYVINKEAEAGVSKELKEAAELVVMCRTFGSDRFAEMVVPSRSAYNAMGQRYKDGATFLFGIGGAKKPDARHLPGNGATTDEIRQLLLNYGVTNAALTTSGDRVGFGWVDRNLLHVQDTPSAGGNSYGAYILK